MLIISVCEALSFPMDRLTRSERRNGGSELGGLSSNPWGEEQTYRLSAHDLT